MSSCWAERAIRPVGILFAVVLLVLSVACGSGGSGSSASANNSTPANSGVSGATGPSAATGSSTTTGSSADTGTVGSIGVTAPIPYSFVAVLVMENTSFSQVIGNTTEAPFLNSLINYQGSNPSAPGALATNYFADAHPSIGNYFMMTTGQLVTTDDTFNLTSSWLSGDSR